MRSLESLVIIASAKTLYHQEYSRKEIAEHLRFLRSFTGNNKAFSKEMNKALIFAEWFISRFEWLDELEAKEVCRILKNTDIEL